MPSAMRAAAVKRWLGIKENYKLIEEAFNSTTNYGRLESVEATIAGRNVVRFQLFIRPNIKIFEIFLNAYYIYVFIVEIVLSIVLMVRFESQ